MQVRVSWKHRQISTMAIFPQAVSDGDTRRAIGIVQVGAVRAGLVQACLKVFRQGALTLQLGLMARLECLLPQPQNRGIKSV